MTGRSAPRGWISSMLGCTIVALLSSCGEDPLCQVQLVNRAAGIGSMQHFVVALTREFSQQTSMNFLDPPEEGSVTLRLINAKLERGGDGEQLSSGVFYYEVVTQEGAVPGSCEGAISFCAKEVAKAVKSVCPSG